MSDQGPKKVAQLVRDQAVANTLDGQFITFEGGEGVGKTTQIKRLVSRLADYGIHAKTSREPGGTPGAEAVRRVLLDRAALESFGPKLEAILLSAARNDHVEQVIRPTLNAGDTMIVDRFMDSTRVYQGATGNIPEEFLQTIERAAIAGVRPDLTIILDLDPETGLARAAARREESVSVDRFEKETVQVHEDRRAKFRQIAREEPERCKLIDASGSPDEVHERIWPFVARLHGLQTEPAQELVDHAGV